MKFKMETHEERVKRLGVWHDFFAVFPREVAPGDMRFLELIERRVKFIRRDLRTPGFWEHQYRSKKDPYEPEPVKTHRPPPPRDGSLRIVTGQPSTT